MFKIIREEYCGETLEVARNLILGATLCTNFGEGLTGGMVTEVEAYLGGGDKASHSYGNKRTKRTEIQFGFGGYAYIFVVYGIHNQFCVVTNIDDKPECVLIRAIEPTIGVDIMKARRDVDDISRLTVGPGNVCKALGIGLEHYGCDLTGDRIYLCRDADKRRKKKEIAVSARIGVDYAEEYKDMPWRFYFKNNKFVSRL